MIDVQLPGLKAFRCDFMVQLVAGNDVDQPVSCAADQPGLVGQVFRAIGQQEVLAQPRVADTVVLLGSCEVRHGRLNFGSQFLAFVIHVIFLVGD